MWTIFITDIGEMNLMKFCMHSITIMKTSNWQLNLIHQSFLMPINKCNCCAFKLGFLQFIYKAFLTLKWNLEISVSIMLKERELYESKHVVVVCNVYKKWDLSLLNESYSSWYIPQS